MSRNEIRPCTGKMDIGSESSGCFTRVDNLGETFAETALGRSRASCIELCDQHARGKSSKVCLGKYAA